VDFQRNIFGFNGKLLGSHPDLLTLSLPGDILVESESQYLTPPRAASVQNVPGTGHRQLTTAAAKEKPMDVTTELDHLFRIEKFLASMTDLDTLLAAVMKECAASLDVESVSLALYEPETDELVFHVARGDTEERAFEQELRSIRIKRGIGVIGWCATHLQPVTINDPYSDDRFDPGADRKTGFVTRSILAVPMVFRDRLVGVLEAVNKKGRHGFSDMDAKLLSILAAQASLVIENARLYADNLEKTRLSAMGQGIAGAAHCIKNILQGIGSGQFVVESGMKQENLQKVGRGWDILKRNTGILRELVMDMLTWSRDREPEKEPTDINTLCRDIAALMQEKAAGKGASIVVDTAPDLGLVEVDPKGIYRCLLNLVSNAVDALSSTETGGGQVTLAVTAEQGTGRLEIAVRDNGCGMTPEQQRQVFDCFFSTKGSKGTGLGLAVTQKIIAEHGGKIQVASTREAGTTFTVSLPV
jgi:signal transduction histidine kinase